MKQCNNFVFFPLFFLADVLFKKKNLRTILLVTVQNFTLQFYLDFFCPLAAPEIINKEVEVHLNNEKKTLVFSACDRTEQSSNTIPLPSPIDMEFNTIYILYI